MDNNDRYFMEKALEQAHNAYQIGEVPIGCVIIVNGNIVSAAHNLREHTELATAHAEMRALDLACGEENSWRLPDSTLYVTVEPCLMCAGAILNARIKRVVYGAANQKAGAVSSLYSVFADDRLNHQVEVESGVMGRQAAFLMKDFFKNKRKKH